MNTRFDDLPVQTAIDLGAPPPDRDLDWGDLTAGERLRRIRNTSRTEAEKGQWFCRMELPPMREAEECEARRIIDKAAPLALDTDEAQLAEWRGKLAREPTVSNQPAPR